MPSFIVVTQPCHVGETVPAVHLHPGATAWPDKKTSTPVSIRLAADERLLYVDDEPQPRSIVSTVSQNNQTTFLVTGPSKALRNADRRRQLAQASALLNQFRDVVLPLKAASEEPEDLIEGLGILFDWIARVRQRLEGGDKSYRQFPTGSFDNEGNPIV